MVAGGVGVNSVERHSIEFVANDSMKCPVFRERSGRQQVAAWHYGVSASFNGFP